MTNRKKSSKNTQVIDLTPFDDDEGNTNVNNSNSKVFSVYPIICGIYTTKNKTKVDIDDSKQKCSSYKTFHSRYVVTDGIFENENSAVFIGKNRFSQLEVAIKRYQLKNWRYCLKENMPEEVFHQNKAAKVNVQNGKGRVLKVLDWFLYSKYLIIVTEYDVKFDDLYDCTMNQPNEHFSEGECKIIFKLLFELVLELNKKGIFHLDIKPSNVLYNPESKEIRIIDFGHAISVNPDENPKIIPSSGTEGLRTPQCVKEEDCYGKDADLWGVAQTTFLCLQGDYAFENDFDVLNKELKFNVDVSSSCKKFFTSMLAKKVKDRMTPQQILNHPWLKPK